MVFLRFSYGFSGNTHSHQYGIGRSIAARFSVRPGRWWRWKDAGNLQLHEAAAHGIPDEIRGPKPRHGFWNDMGRILGWEMIHEDSINGVVPQIGSMVCFMEKILNMDDWGVSPFRETSRYVLLSLKWDGNWSELWSSECQRDYSSELMRIDGYVPWGLSFTVGWIYRHFLGIKQWETWCKPTCVVLGPPLSAQTHCVSTLGCAPHDH